VAPSRKVIFLAASARSIEPPPDKVYGMSVEPEKKSEMVDDGESPRGAVRGGFEGWTQWSEAEHTATDIRECTDQHCMNVEVNCGFQGLDPNSPLSQSAAVSDDLRAAWRAKLVSEGKPTAASRPLRDVIFG
jgi:hypothetical protein